MSLRYIPDSPPPDRYARRSPETWLKAREDYVAGVPAPEVCDRYGLGLSNLRQPAEEEGWRRRDMDDPDPEPPIPTGAPADPKLMAEQAWARAARAIERGRVLEASRWTKLAAELRAQAEAAAEAARKLHERNREARARAEAAEAGG